MHGPKLIYTVTYKWYTGDKMNVSTLEVENVTASTDFGVLNFWQGSTLVRSYGVGEWINLTSRVKE